MMRRVVVAPRPVFYVSNEIGLRLGVLVHVPPLLLGEAAFERLVVAPHLGFRAQGIAEQQEPPPELRAELDDMNLMRPHAEALLHQEPAVRHDRLVLLYVVVS